MASGVSRPPLFPCLLAGVKSFRTLARRTASRALLKESPCAFFTAGRNYQPDGLRYAVGLQNMSGTTLSGASCNQMAELSAIQNAPDDGIAFLGTPTVRRILQGRERASGSGFVWDKGIVSDHRAAVTTDLPAGSLVCGPWSQIYVGMFGPGFQVEFNPYDPTGFRSGVIQGRLILSVDVCVRNPAAFIWATSVT